jgi:hypothetical protein
LGGAVQGLWGRRSIKITEHQYLPTYLAWDPQAANIGSTSRIVWARTQMRRQRAACSVQRAALGQTLALPCETTYAYAYAYAPLPSTRRPAWNHGRTWAALAPFQHSIQPSTPTAHAHTRTRSCQQWMGGWVGACMATLAACLLPACRPLRPAASVPPPVLLRHLSQCIAAGVWLGALPIMTWPCTLSYPLPAPLHRTGPVIYAQRAGDLVWPWALRPASSAGLISLRPPASLSYSSTPHSPRALSLCHLVWRRVSFSSLLFPSPFAVSSLCAV